jgi:hypothetical protein
MAFGKSRESSFSRKVTPPSPAYMDSNQFGMDDRVLGKSNEPEMQLADMIDDSL